MCTEYGSDINACGEVILCLAFGCKDALTSSMSCHAWSSLYRRFATVISPRHCCAAHRKGPKDIVNRHRQYPGVAQDATGCERTARAGSDGYAGGGATSQRRQPWQSRCSMGEFLPVCSARLKDPCTKRHLPRRQQRRELTTAHGANLLPGVRVPPHGLGRATVRARLGDHIFVRGRLRELAPHAVGLGIHRRIGVRWEALLAMQYEHRDRMCGRGHLRRGRG